jgi:altronate dehydratase
MANDHGCFSFVGAQLVYKDRTLQGLAVGTNCTSLIVIGERHEGVAAPNAQGEHRD